MEQKIRYTGEILLFFPYGDLLNRRRYELITLVLARSTSEMFYASQNSDNQLFLFLWVMLDWCCIKKLQIQRCTTSIGVVIAVIWKRMQNTKYTYVGTDTDYRKRNSKSIRSKLISGYLLVDVGARFDKKVFYGLFFSRGMLKPMRWGEGRNTSGILLPNIEKKNDILP